MTNTEALIARRNQVVPKCMNANYGLAIAQAQGATFTDLDGKQYIDFIGGIGVLNAGHCPPKVVEAICAQAQKFLHSCFMVISYEPYVALCERLAQLLPHGEQTKVMLTNTGSESVENAIKVARQATGRQAVICYTGAFHGRSMMALSLTSKGSFKQGSGPYAAEVYRLPFPDYYRRGQGLSEQAFCQQELRELRRYLLNVVDASQVAAIIIEPVQGEGGFVPVPADYLKGLREVCDQHGILLVFDEVQSGFGRTGAWGAYQRYGITPDISTWAKSLGSGLPIGAVLGKAHLMDACKPGTLGGTFLGNPLSCAAALATLDYMEEVDINALGVQVGQQVMDFFKELQAECPAIGDVRGLGAMVGIELVKQGDPYQPDTELTRALVQACAREGVAILSAGLHANVVRILSPLVIDPAQLRKGLETIRQQLLALYAERLEKEYSTNPIG